MGDCLAVAKPTRSIVDESEANMLDNVAVDETADVKETR